MSYNSPPGPKFESVFFSKATRFWVTGQFKTSALKNSSAPEQAKVKYTCDVVLVPRVPNLHWVIAEMTLNTKGLTESHTGSKCTLELHPNWNLFFSNASPFRVPGHFEIYAPNDIIVTLNTERWKLHYILQLSPSPNFNPVCSMASCLKISAPNDSKI